uniref:prostaglandin-endoperoxide synthase n=1 Tax=Cavibelonia sp. JCH-2014 TaxID=1541967 RepID=A0A0U2LLK9_9MOLL|nr:cyclooxygenase b [Cavibelonia sp. JCH-2014]
MDLLYQPSRRTFVSYKRYTKRTLTLSAASVFKISTMQLAWGAAVFALTFSTCCLAQTETSENAKGHDPCCSFPCQNRGVCTSGLADYECDCANSGFYGRNCEHATFGKSIAMFFELAPSTKHYLLINFKWFWDIFSSFDFLQRALMKLIYEYRASNIYNPPVYTSEHEYVTMEAAYNRSYFARSLPPVHENCPTPMGVAGKNVLPSPQVVADTLLKRNVFKPDPLHHSILLPTFGQFFTHQFFRTDRMSGPGFQFSRHMVDASNIYGINKHRENLLRSFRGGRLKSQIIKDEEYPPDLKDAPVKMLYQKQTTESQKFALGHEFFSIFPTLFLWSTIWLREHNRVAGVLAKEHPHWPDEQLFQTSKIILVGETIQVVIRDYIQAISNYNVKLSFQPDVLFGSPYQYQNRIALEFDHLYHFHPMMPDELHVGNTTYTVEELMFHPEVVVEHGVSAFTEALSKQVSGAMTLNNHGKDTLHIAERLIEAGRKVRLQPFNQYRKRFHLPPFTSFYELTGNQEMADKLEALYGDIDGVEFYVGLLAEKPATNAKFGLTFLQLVASYAIKGLLSNPICSPDYWKPSTFGGEVGFNIVKEITMEQLFCRNIKGKCPLVSMTVPGEFVEQQKCSGGRCGKGDL